MKNYYIVKYKKDFYENKRGINSKIDEALCNSYFLYEIRQNENIAGKFDNFDTVMFAKSKKQGEEIIRERNKSIKDAILLRKE